ncbi:MAG: hypothetical protein ACRD4O_12960 [Bryobacteraceae bacterium]
MYCRHPENHTGGIVCGDCIVADLDREAEIEQKHLREAAQELFAIDDYGTLFIVICRAKWAAQAKGDALAEAQAEEAEEIARELHMRLRGKAVR